MFYSLVLSSSGFGSNELIRLGDHNYPALAKFLFIMHYADALNRPIGMVLKREKLRSMPEWLPRLEGSSRLQFHHGMVFHFRSGTQ